MAEMKDDEDYLRAIAREVLTTFFQRPRKPSGA
jgi:hypothetical protein